MLHKVGRDDETDTTQGVREDVNEDTTHVLVRAALRMMTVVVMVVIMEAVTVTGKNAGTAGNVIATLDA